MIEVIPFLQHFLKTAGDRIAKIAVTDDAIQLAEVFLVFENSLGNDLHDKFEVFTHGGCVLLV
jgi:hypothetical protein